MIGEFLSAALVCVGIVIVTLYLGFMLFKLLDKSSIPDNTVTVTVIIIMLGLAFGLFACVDATEPDVLIVQEKQKCWYCGEAGTTLYCGYCGKSIEEEETYAWSRYDLYLEEQPKESMWEFTYALRKQDRVYIGAFKPEEAMAGTLYNIEFLKKESLTGEGYRYFIEISGISGTAASIEVTEETIDDRWNKLMETMKAYNSYAAEMKEKEDVSGKEFVSFREYIYLNIKKGA